MNNNGYFRNNDHYLMNNGFYIMENKRKKEINKDKMKC